MRFLCNSLFFIMLLFVQNVGSTEVKDLYEIEVLAKSRSNEDRNEAFQLALTQVFGRVLVADDMTKIPRVNSAIIGAANYVRQFQYSMSAKGRYNIETSRMMRVLFDEQQLLTLLRDSEVGIWSEIRPETLVWLVVEENEQSQFYTPDKWPELEMALNRAANLKGLPVLYPLLDMEEQQKITVSEVLSTDSTRLLAVSERYDVVSVLAGRVTKKEDCWEAEWGLHFDEKISQWTSSACGELNKVALDGMQGVYDVLSRYYAVKPELHKSSPSDSDIVKVHSIQEPSQLQQEAPLR